MKIPEWFEEYLREKFSTIIPLWEFIRWIDYLIVNCSYGKELSAYEKCHRCVEENTQKIFSNDIFADLICT